MKKLEKILRYFYAYFIFILTLFFSGCIVNFLQCFLYNTLRPLNKELYRKINYYFCYALYTQLMFLAEWYAGAEIILYIDKSDYKKYLGKEHAYIVSNHSYEIDWLMLGLLSEKMHCAGNFKAFIKKLIQYVPAIGWSLYFSDNIFLERSFNKDKTLIKEQITKLVSYSDPIWLLLYPEGTRYTPIKHEASLKIAKERGLPELKNLLLPRTKGFVTSLDSMRNKMPALYDITVTFNSNDIPTINNIFMGGKMQVHIYLKRISFDLIPIDEDGAKIFLQNMFIRKDKLKGSFLNTGDYFAESGIEKLEAMKLNRSYYVFMNSIFWQITIMGPLFYYLLNMLLNNSFYDVGLVYAMFFLFSFGLSKLFGVSQIQKSSKYGVNTK